MTTKRGLASPCVHSALPITRRRRDQLIARGVAEVLVAAGGPSGGGRLSLRLEQFGGDLLDEPRVAGETEHEVDPVRSRHAISAARAKPESARKRMRARGQRARIRATIRAISSLAPALPSIFEGLSLAASRCRPQNT